MVVFMAQSCLRRSGSCLTRRCLFWFDLRYEPELRYSFSCAVYGIIGMDCSFVFATILSCCGSKRYCYIDMAHMHNGVGIRSTLASTDPTVAMHPIQDHYSTLPGGMLGQKKIVRKNLQSTVADAVPDRA